MKNLPLARISWLRLATLATSLLTLLLAFFLFVPVFVALRAGIAGVSLLIFFPLLIVAVTLAIVTWRKQYTRTTFLALFAAIVALFGLVGPQAAYLEAAREQNIHLSYQPLSYVKFTGDSIAPAKTFVYKELQGQQLHIAVYNEDLATAKPTVILLHGGGWQYGNYLRTNNWANLFRYEGYQVISVEYRLATPDMPTWDQAPADVRDAISFIKSSAPKLGVSADQIALMGQSAGGHLALLEANASASVRAVVGLYAPTDLSDDFRLSIDKNAELAFLGGTPSDFPERYRAVSVPAFVTASSPATLLIQGLSDDLVDSSSSVHLTNQLNELGVTNRLILLPYTGHSFDNQVGGFATQIAEKATLDFLARHLKRS